MLTGGKMTILLAIITFTFLGSFLGFILGISSKIFKSYDNPLLDEVESMLPGLQCGQCGFVGCKPAAEALVANKVNVDICPPGGSALSSLLAKKLSLPVLVQESIESRVAFIDVDNCIGCSKCFRICPTDAIVGASRQQHTVIKDACIACKKCVDICPTECIKMESIEPTLSTYRWSKPHA